MIATFAELLVELERRNVQVWIEGGALRYRAVAGPVDEGLGEALQRFEDELRSSVRDVRHDRSCLIPLNVTTSRELVFCAHAIDGSPLIYRELANRLAPKMKVFGLNVRSFLLDGKPFRTVEQMAAYYVEQVRLVQRTGPHRIFGFSTGGIIALEMAQQLSEQCDAAPLVLLGDTEVDRYSQSEPRFRWLFFSEMFISKQTSDFLGAWSNSRHPFWAESEDGKLRFLAARRLAEGGSRTDALAAVRNDYDVFNAYVHAYKEYRPRPYRHPVVFLVVGNDPRRAERMVSSLGIVDPILVNAGVGDHLQLVRPPGVARTATVLATLENYVSRAARKASARVLNQQE